MGSGRLDRDARDARGDACEDFPGDGGGGFGVVESSDGFAALRAEKDNLVAVLDAGNLCHVNHNLIHADTAHERCALAAHQKLKMIAERAGEAVTVPL